MADDARVWALHALGWSSRLIAAELGMGATSVRRAIRRQPAHEPVAAGLTGEALVDALFNSEDPTQILAGMRARRCGSEPGYSERCSCQRCPWGNPRGRRWPALPGRRQPQFDAWGQLDDDDDEVGQ